MVMYCIVLKAIHFGFFFGYQSFQFFFPIQPENLFLKKPPTTVCTRLIKTNTNKSNHIVKNFNNIASSFRGCI